MQQSRRRFGSSHSETACESSFTSGMEKPNHYVEPGDPASLYFEQRLYHLKATRFLATHLLGLLIKH
jgi:hypothetical protein